MKAIDNDTTAAAASPGTALPAPSASYSSAVLFGYYLTMTGAGPVSVHLPGSDPSKASGVVLDSTAPRSGFLGPFNSATLTASPVRIVDTGGSAVDYTLVALTDEGT